MGPSPDWVKLAEAFGAKGMQIEKEADLVAGIKECLDHDGPVVCDVRVTQEENCYPMIPAGPGRAGHGGLRRWVSQAPKKC